MLAKIEIRGNKIWVITDNTEDGVATELVAKRIGKEQIVLGFYLPATREIGEFAVA